MPYSLDTLEMDPARPRMPELDDMASEGRLDALKGGLPNVELGEPMNELLLELVRPWRGGLCGTARGWVPGPVPAVGPCPLELYLVN